MKFALRTLWFGLLLWIANLLVSITISQFFQLIILILIWTVIVWIYILYYYVKPYKNQLKYLIWWWILLAIICLILGYVTIWHNMRMVVSVNYLQDFSDYVRNYGKLYILIPILTIVTWILPKFKAKSKKS